MASNLKSGRSLGNSKLTHLSMSEREAAAGLNLSGNNPTSGRGLGDPTMDEREFDAGLTLSGNRTTNQEFKLQNILEDRDNFIEQETSIIRQRSSRARRSQEKRIKQKYEEAIQNASNTREKRQAKKAREEEIENTRQQIEELKNAVTEDLNKVGTGDSIHEDSIDKTGSAPDNSTSNPAGGGNVPPALEDYTETTVTICINGTPTTGTIFFKAS
jgi:FKBP-type peptidyl-prolyl cis-trans isomerase